jgi:hypothetical protein
MKVDWREWILSDVERQKFDTLTNAGQEVHYQPPRGGSSVEGFLQAHQGDMPALKELHKLVEVDHTAGETIKLVDDHYSHLAGLYPREQALQARPLEAPGAHSLIADDLSQRPIIHRSIGVDLRLLGAETHPSRAWSSVEPLAQATAGMNTLPWSF